MASLPKKGRRDNNGDVSVVDVAKQADVSIGTVSRVFNGHANVNASLKERVLIASRQLGFVPKKHNNAIAVITGRPNPFSPLGYVTTVMALTARELAKYRYTMELVDIDNLDMAYQAHVDGVLGVVFDERIVTLRNVPNLPVMTFNAPLKEHGIHSVCTNHYQQVDLAMKHLIAKGHRRIAYLENTFDTLIMGHRLDAYKTCLQQAGIEFDPLLLQTTQDTMGQPLYDVLARLMKKGITALLNFSEDCELEVVHILRNILNVSIPDQLSVVTMENIPVFQYLTPPHTVIRQPWEEMVRIGVEKLIGLCGNASTTSADIIDIMLPCELVERDSVKHIHD